MDSGISSSQNNASKKHSVAPIIDSSNAYSLRRKLSTKWTDKRYATVTSIYHLDRGGEGVVI